MGTVAEIGNLAAISARLGLDPLLVQAATGNTSLKQDGVMWIKASGQWLAHAATDDIMIPVDLAETRRRVDLNIDPAGQSAIVNGKALGTSVETAMHAVLPWRVVLHVHSVNTIAWAVRLDGERELRERLSGLPWRWIPYVSSGLPLARLIRQELKTEPQTRVLVLANHGLVVCGEDCESADSLLREIEARVAVNPRPLPQANLRVLEALAAPDSWELPADPAVHSIASDSVSKSIVSDGVLYPCQAIFLTPAARAVSSSISAAELASLDEPFLLVGDCGVLVRRHPNPAASATLAGLAQVLRRIPASAPVRYLRDDEVRDLLCADVYHYRAVVEGNSTPVDSSEPVTTF